MAPVECLFALSVVQACAPLLLFSSFRGSETQSPCTFLLVFYLVLATVPLFGWRFLSDLWTCLGPYTVKFQCSWMHCVCLWMPAVLKFQNFLDAGQQDVSGQAGKQH